MFTALCRGIYLHYLHNSTFPRFDKLVPCICYLFTTSILRVVFEIPQIDRGYLRMECDNFLPVFHLGIGLGFPIKLMLSLTYDSLICRCVSKAGALRVETGPHLSYLQLTSR